MDFILNLFVQYLIPMMLVGAITEIIKYLFFKKIKVGKTIYELIMIFIALIISALISFPFSFIDKEFVFSEYLKTVLICWLLAGKVYDVIKKKYFDTEDE